MPSSLILLFPFSHGTAAVESTDRSPRPTSAPAIAQSRGTEGVPGAPAKKTVASKEQKETVEVEVEKEEVPPEQAEPEATEIWQVCPKSTDLANLLFCFTGGNSLARKVFKVLVLTGS